MQTPPALYVVALLRQLGERLLHPQRLASEELIPSEQGAFGLVLGSEGGEEGVGLPVEACGVAESAVWSDIRHG